MKITSHNRQNLYRVAEIAFVVLLFFTFFGTSLPFRDKITDVEDVKTSNIINQIVFSFLFLVSSISLVSKKKELYLLIRKEKFLSIFLLWCLLSTLWSDFSIVSLKRLFQLITSVIVIISILIYADSSVDTLKYFKAILLIYIPVCFLTIFIVKGAIDPSTLTWRGLASSKNHLGQISLMSIIICYIAIKNNTFKTNKLYILILGVSLILLFGSKSMTSIFTLILTCSIGSIFWIESRLRNLGIGWIFSFLLISSMVSLFALFIVLAPEMITAVPSYFGKDITFTGRTYLWLHVLDEAKKHLIFGCGYSGFWVMENKNLINLYEEFVWLPFQSHLGYLDILNETGLIGFLIFLGMVVKYFKDLIYYNKLHLWVWPLIAALIINLQETSLFSPKVLTGLIFIFSYLAFYADLTNKNAEKY